MIVRIRVLLLVLTLTLPVANFAIAQIAQNDLDELIAAVRPKPEEEKWLEIPWRTNLAEARRDANEQGKPMFMWLMNGDPLGCT